MRERHNWASDKHPKTCTCAECQARRARGMQQPVKKKRKPKSQRGKPKPKLDAYSAIDEALSIFNFPSGSEDGDDKSDRGSDT